MSHGVKIPHLVQVTVTKNREAPRLAFTKEYPFDGAVPTILNVLADPEAVRARFPMDAAPGDLIQVNLVLHVGERV